MDTKRKKEMFDRIHQTNKRTRKVTKKIRKKLPGWLKERDEAEKNKKPDDFYAGAGIS